VGKNIPNDHKNVPNGRKNIPNDHKFTNIFHYNALQNVPKLGFLVCKHTDHLATQW
jgi:hypothetical protein